MFCSPVQSCAMAARRALTRALGRPWCQSVAAASAIIDSPVRVYGYLNPVEKSSPWGLYQARFCEREIDREGRGGEGSMTIQEAKRFIRQVNVQALKRQLYKKECPCIDYTELANLCREMGLAESPDDARKLVLAMDEAGDIVLFRDKVYLDAERIAELVSRALPVHADDPKIKEFEALHDRKEEINEIANKQVRLFLWLGLLALTGGTGLFVRLTFWELSWDVMEPIAFFMTSTFIIAGYAYFLISRRDPTYQGLMHSMLASRKRRLMKKMRFDYLKYKELERQCTVTCKHSRLRQMDDDD